MGDYDPDSPYEENEDELVVPRTQLTPKVKAKRRTRKDNFERGFKCGCGKDYLSYPALYTHVKQKHNGETPVGTDAPTSSGPRRGRRRRLHIPPLPQSPPPPEDFFIRHEDLSGGPIDPISEYPLGSYPGGATEKSDDFVYTQIVKLKENDRKMEGEIPTCDEVFAQYLMEVAERVNTQGYTLFVAFVQALRMCLNQRGWELSGQTSSSEGGIYSEVQPATNLPEVSNYFITDFLEDEEVDLDREKAISMMLHFNEFLFTHRYSNLKLSLLGNE